MPYHLPPHRGQTAPRLCACVYIRIVLALMGPETPRTGSTQHGALRYIQSRNYHFCTREYPGRTGQRSVLYGEFRHAACFAYFIDFAARIIVVEWKRAFSHLPHLPLNSRQQFSANGLIKAGYHTRLTRTNAKALTDAEGNGETDGLDV